MSKATCSACDEVAVPDRRWCQAHVPVFDVAPLRTPRAETAGDRAREAVIRFPDWSNRALAVFAACNHEHVSRARAALKIYRDEAIENELSRYRAAGRGDV